jgi:hypothetical protein
MPELYHQALLTSTAEGAVASGVAYLLGPGSPEESAAFGEFALDVTIELGARPRAGVVQRPGIGIYVAGRLVLITDLVQSWTVHRSIDQLLQNWAFTCALRTPSGVFGNVFNTLGSPIGLGTVTVYGVLRTSTGVHLTPLITGGIVDDPGTINVSPSGYIQTFSGVDRGGRYDGRIGSLVLGPGHGLRRDQIGQRLLTSVGESQFKLHPMNTCYKELQLVDVNPLDKTQEVWDSEGRKLNWDTTGWVVNPAIGPPDPDSTLYTLTEQDILAVATVTISPPHDPPTRVTITGSKQELQDACGLTSPPVLITTIKRVFAPVYQTQVQHVDATLDPLTVPTQSIIERIEKQVIVYRIYRCGVLLYQRVETYEWYNELAARYLYTALSPISITSITRSGSIATATVASTTALADGDVADISGAIQPEYNGSFVIGIASGTTFTFTVEGAPATPATGTIVFGASIRTALESAYLGDDAAPGLLDGAQARLNLAQSFILTSVAETWNVYNRPGYADIPSGLGYVGVSEELYNAVAKLTVDLDHIPGSPRDGIRLGSVVRTQTMYAPKSSLKTVTSGTAIDATPYANGRYALGTGEGINSDLGAYERLRETVTVIETVEPFVEDDGEISFEKRRETLTRSYYARPGAKYWYAGGIYSTDQTEIYDLSGIETVEYQKNDGKNGHTVFQFVNNTYNGQPSSSTTETKDGAPPAMERLPVDENAPSLYGTSAELGQKVEAVRGDTSTIHVTVVATDLEARYRRKDITINLPYIENDVEALAAAKLALLEGASMIVKFVTGANFLLATIPSIHLRVQAAGLDHDVSIRDLQWSGGAGQPVLTTVECRQYPVLRF